MAIIRGIDHPINNRRDSAGTFLRSYGLHFSCLLFNFANDTFNFFFQLRNCTWLIGIDGRLHETSQAKNSSHHCVRFYGSLTHTTNLFFALSFAQCDQLLRLSETTYCLNPY